MNKIMWQYIGMCMLFTVIPTIIVGGGHLTIYGIEMFTILSLIVPILMKKVERLRFATGFRMSLYQHFYSWIWWTIFFFVGTGTMRLVIPVQNLALIGLLWVVVLSCVLLIILLSAVVLTRFADRERKNDIVDTTLDLAMYSLPIPILLLGSVLYVDNEIFLLANQAVLFDYVKFCLYLLIVLTMGAIVIRLYPKGHTPKKVRFPRILMTALAWLAIVGHVMFGWIPEPVLQFVRVAFPVYSANPLVYITPTIFFLLVLTVSVAIGALVERYLMKWRHKRRLARGEV